MSTIKVDKITGRTGTGGASSPLQLTGDTLNIIKLTPTTTANAPTGTEGALYYDSDKNSLMQYGTSWVSKGGIICEGGIEQIYTVGGITYRSHTFLSSGFFTAPASTSVDMLVVAGGGAAPTRGHNWSEGWSGGGGAGGFRTATSVTVSGTYTVTVGEGGIINSNGGNSSVGTLLVSTGGGKGGSYGGGGSNGGSGGGGGGEGGSGAAGNAGSYSPVEGYRGGNTDVGGNTDSEMGGGGGGAGARGGDNNANGTGGEFSVGGAGATNDYRTGINVYYAGGGGGGTGRPDQTDNVSSVGGIGGGGDGGQARNGTNYNTEGAGSGEINTGGGGGAGTPGGKGGSGIVVIRYVI